MPDSPPRPERFTARTGRANGWARPSVTGRGIGSRLVNRVAHRPRPGFGVRPTASASTLRKRPARAAAIRAVTATTRSAPPTTTTSTQSATPLSFVP